MSDIPLAVDPAIPQDDTTIYVKQYGIGANSSCLAIGKNRIAVGTPTPTSSFQVDQPTTGPGTVYASGQMVTGYGTQFLNTFKIGDTIIVQEQMARTIVSVNADDSLTVYPEYIGSVILLSAVRGLRLRETGIAVSALRNPKVCSSWRIRISWLRHQSMMRLITIIGISCMQLWKFKIAARSICRRVPIVLNKPFFSMPATVI